MTPSTPDRPAPDSCTSPLPADPASAEAYAALAVSLKGQGLLADAITAIDQALRLDPASAAACNVSGLLRAATSRPREAEAAYRRALALQPEYTPAMTNLAALLQVLGQCDEAETLYQTAIAQQPERPQAYINMAIMLTHQSRVGEAAHYFQAAYALQPDAGTAVSLALLLPHVARSAEELRQRRLGLGCAIDRLAASGTRIEDPARQVLFLTYLLAYHGVNVRDLQMKLARFFIGACPELTWTAPHCHPTEVTASDGQPVERLRVGFVSGHLRAHTIGRFNHGLIERLDRSRFHVTVFQIAPSHVDTLSEAIAQSADQAVFLTGPLATMRQTIAAAELDILLYPDIGLDTIPYFLAFARLAPVQCVTWGHPLTTGIPNMDYFLSSRDLETSGAQARYSETLFQADSLYPCYPLPSVPTETATRAQLGLPADATLYLFAQSLYKLHPDFDAVLIEILRRDPNARLVLVSSGSPYWCDFLIRRLAELAPELTGRIQFLDPVSKEGFYGLLRAADAVLDAHHFSGGNTTYDASAAGVPVVTWPGEMMSSRISYAMYRQLGMTETVATDAETYVATAVRLANDPAWRAQLQLLIVAGQSRLFGVETGIRELEGFFANAVRAARRGAGLES